MAATYIPEVKQTHSPAGVTKARINGTTPSSSYGTFVSNGYNDVNEHSNLIEDRDEEESTCERYTSCRWTLTYLGFILNVLHMCMRSCISMALVCIHDLDRDDNVVDSPGNVSIRGSTSHVGVDTLQNNGTSISNRSEYIPAVMEGLVLSSYYYGYVLTPLLGGIVAEKVGSKSVLTVAMTLCATLTILTPTAIRLHVYLTVTLRCLLGFVAGVCIPALMSMWTDWAPIHEKARIVSIAASGVNIGILISNLASGFLCSIPLDEGWPFIFYTYGAATLLWTVLWHLLVQNTPSVHPRISRKERKMLAVHCSARQDGQSAKAWPPLKAILTCVPVIALLTVQIADAWLFCLIGTYTPLYFSEMLMFDTEMSGTLSSLPFLACFLGTWIFAILADRLHASGLMSKTNNRKLFQAIGLLLPAALLCGLAALDQELRYLAVAFIVVAEGLHAASNAGYILVRLDMAPRFAGTMSGLAICISNIAAMVAPIIVSDITSDKTEGSWDTVFYMSAAMCLAGSVVFLIFGSAVEQDWAKNKDLSITRVIEKTDRC